ncbi:MAG TPA: LON peptidase substrate-binding domain-containing protein [Candidatus Dormibacteraeota bacterium]|nr:LON peptidase substrate-binding domain-containing protein [Candidatus Dormibacteraeota bacterium]
MDRPTRIPLFPLDVVLFPKMPLPLHIFEPRYKVMIRRCLKEKLEFGLVLAASQGAATVGCTAEIMRTVREYPDGRMDILTEGRAVFRLDDLIDEKEYYEGRVEYLADNPFLRDLEKEAKLLEAYSECHALLVGQAWPGVLPEENSILTYRLAAQLPVELETRQMLLEMRSESERRSRLLSWISEFLPKLKESQRVQQLASGNGHGYVN